MQDSFKDLIKASKIVKGKEKAGQALSETEKQRDDLLKLINDKENQILKRKQNLEEFMTSLEKFSERLNDVQKATQVPLDLNEMEVNITV